MKRVIALCCFAAFGSGLADAAETAPAPSPTPTQVKIRKTEITAADNWTITCTWADQANAKRRCAADLKVLQVENGSQRVVFNWEINTPEGKISSFIASPTGVLIGPGVQMKLGDKEPKKLNYYACLPDHCETIVPIDEATSKALSAAQTVDFTVQGANGAAVKFSVTLKGFEEALAAVMRKE